MKDQIQKEKVRNAKHVRTLTTNQSNLNKNKLFEAEKN